VRQPTFPFHPHHNSSQIRSRKDGALTSCRQVWGSWSAYLQASLDVFRDWYCCVRPHANLHGATPMEAWLGIDPHRCRPKRVEWFSAWDGLLTGYRIRRE
jgi:hypothetical protein